MKIHSTIKEEEVVKVLYTGKFDKHELDLYMAQNYPFELYRITTRMSNQLRLKLLSQ